MNYSKPGFTWRETVTTMTDKFIPGLSHKLEDVIARVKSIRTMRARRKPVAQNAQLNSEKKILLHFEYAVEVSFLSALSLLMIVYPLVYNWNYYLNKLLFIIKLTKELYGNEVMANLPLQMALYFNVVLVPIWFIILIIHMISQYPAFNELYKFITFAIVITLLSIEALRLYLGYEGNLRDKIPELAGFWMLSVLLQLPLQTFLLLNPYFKLHVVTRTIQFIMCVLLMIQLISGYSALKYTANKQATYVRIMNLHNHVPASSKESKYKIQ